AKPVPGFKLSIELLDARGFLGKGIDRDPADQLLKAIDPAKQNVIAFKSEAGWLAALLQHLMNELETQVLSIHISTFIGTEGCAEEGKLTGLKTSAVVRLCDYDHDIHIRGGTVNSMCDRT